MGQRFSKDVAGVFTLARGELISGESERFLVCVVSGCFS
jgi:hypothetical protein